MPKYETALNPQEEQSFQRWKTANAPNDSGEDYDLRGAFKAGVNPAANGHWPDTFKKPNHPTFSNESQYATADAPHWEGNRLISRTGTLVADETPRSAGHKTISIPDVGDIDFPDSMSDADITKAAQNLHGQAQFDKTKAQMDAQPQMGMLDQAKALAGAALSPITSIPGAIKSVADFVRNPGSVAARHLNPETASSVPGAMSVNPPADAYGNLIAAVPGAKGEVNAAAANRAAVLDRMGVQAPAAAPKPSAGIARMVFDKVAAKHPLVKKGMLAIDLAKAIQEAMGEPAATETTIDGQPRPFAPPPAPRLIGDHAPTPTQAAPAAGADYLMPAPEPQIPAGASPSQMATFSPQTVLDYLRGQGRPVPETPSEAVSASPKGKVATIPAPEPEFAAETYKAAAQVKKANATAKWLNENGIDYDTFRSQMEAATPEMRESTLKEAARLSGENQLNSPESLSLMLLELKRLGKQGKLARLPAKASKAAQDLGTLE